MSYPLIKQHDQSDCGPASLASIFKYYGVAVNFEKLRDISGTDKTGTNFSELKKTAEAFGFSAEGIEAAYDGIKPIDLPAVAHVIGSNGLPHFVVLYRADAASVVIARPESGVEKISKEAFLNIWTGRLLIVKPEVNNIEKTQRENPRKMYFALIKKNGGLIIPIFILSAVLTAMGMSSAIFIKYLVDEILVKSNASLLNIFIIGLLLVLAVQTIINFIKQKMLINLSKSVNMGILPRFVRHIIRLPLKFFESRRTGDILSRVIDSFRISHLASGATLSVAVNTVLIIIYFVVMANYNLWLTLVVTGFLPVVFLNVVSHMKSIKKMTTDLKESQSELESQMVEDISGIAAIKSAAAEENRVKASEKKVVKVIEVNSNLQSISLRLEIISSAITLLLTITVLWLGAVQVLSGALTIGGLMFFYSLLGSVVGPVNVLANSNTQLQDGIIALERLSQIMTLDQEGASGKEEKKLDDLKESIIIENLTFAYHTGRNVLKDINITIPAGKTIAIIGESGSGKTTLLKLLMRFYEPGTGAIKWDHQNIDSFHLNEYRKKIGFVPQEPKLFQGTFSYNITMGNDSIPKEKVQAAARAVEMHDFIQSLPDGYDSIIGESGILLSGGQKQRIALARAIVHDPQILILDEATSQIDVQVEDAIQRNLDARATGKTVILVTHRLSTAKNAGLIYVLRDGEVVESGKPEELIRSGKVFAKMWKLQSLVREE